ncbi:MAG TPA: S41 family peptidase [Thermoanaerobaculia bacterium]|nr:S41 family peptidase [Thermoanaerobaculia bacterium]
MKTLAALLLFSTLIDAPARKEIGAKIAESLETMYVEPERGKELAAKVRADFAAGKYDSATTPKALAEAVTKDFAAANDRHLYVRVQSEVQQPRGPQAPKNHGFRSVQRLEPNLGYIDVGLFAESDDARAMADAAMAFVQGTDAVIVDVRRCPGGSGQQVAYLASYFFGPEPVVLANRFHRPSGRSMQSVTGDVKGKRMPNVPLYILTSPGTGSACESFAFSLQQHGRAKVVGATTGGAGYNNAMVPLGHDLVFSVSIGSVTHPKTGKGWQGTGVQPDIATTADKALDAARAAAGAPAVDPAEEVRKLEREWLDAYEQRDPEAMKRIVADDFIIYFPDGKSQTKADIVRMMERMRGSQRPPSKFSTEEVTARAYGSDTVVLTGRVISQTGDEREVQRYTDTYVRRDGRWQVASSHLSNVK